MVQTTYKLTKKTHLIHDKEINKYVLKIYTVNSVRKCNTWNNNLFYVYENKPQKKLPGDKIRQDKIKPDFSKLWCQSGSRTPTPLRGLGPQPSASANSATLPVDVLHSFMFTNGSAMKNMLE